MTLTVEMQANTYSRRCTGQPGTFSHRRYREIRRQSRRKRNQASFRRRPGIAAPWVRLAAVDLLKGDQRAIDQLVERHPKLAGPIGDLFARGRTKKDWRRAIALYSKGITEQTTDVDLLSKRARAHEALKNWDAAAADWSRAAAGNPDGGKTARRVRTPTHRRRPGPMAKAQFVKARALYERSLAADPEMTWSPRNWLNSSGISTRTRPRHWTVLTPAEMKSDSGVALTVKDDRSILVKGNFTAKDNYSVDFRDVPKDVHAIRLEALRDERLPGGGPGTLGGLFVLSEFKAFRLDEKPGSPPKPIPLQAACATFEERPAQQSLDLAPQGGWSIAGGQHQSQSAYFSVGRDTNVPVSDRLRILLGFSQVVANGSPATLGCFRLSVSADASASSTGRKIASRS